MESKDLINSLDFYKMTEDYSNILLRINRYKDNGGKVYNLPINTYNVAISEIEKYLEYLDSQILLIDQEISKLDNNKKAEGELLMASKRLEMLKSQFINLGNSFKKVVEKEDGIDIFVKSLNDYNIDSKEEMLKLSDETEVLTQEFKKYKAYQEKLSTILDLDDTEELESEKDKHFINKQVLFLNEYNNLMSNYIDKLEYINDFEKDYKIIFSIKLSNIIKDKYTLTFDFEKDSFYKDITENIVSFDYIIDSINTIHKTIKTLKELETIHDEIKFTDTDNVIGQINDLLSNNILDDMGKEFRKKSNELFTKYNLEKTIDSYYNIKDGIDSIYSNIKRIKDSILNINNISENNKNSLLNIYYTKLGGINYNELFFDEIKYTDIVSEKLHNLLLENINNITNTKNSLDKHIQLINLYFSEYIDLENIGEYVSNNIASLNSNINTNIKNEIFAGKTIIISKYRPILSKKLSEGLFYLYITNYSELKTFIEDLKPIKTELDNEINAFNNDIQLIKNIQSKINSYSYDGSDTINNVKNSILESNANKLKWITAGFIISELSNSLTNAFNESKSDYEYKKEQERLAKKRREEEARRRRQASYSSSSSSSSSWGSSSSWSSSSSSSSSFSSSYGGSSSF